MSSIESSLTAQFSQSDAYVETADDYWIEERLFIYCVMVLTRVLGDQPRQNNVSFCEFKHVLV